MIDNKTIQLALQTLDFYQGPIDGKLGPLSYQSITSALAKHLGSATDKWNDARKLVAFQQLMLKLAGLDIVGSIDGFVGPLTTHAIEQWHSRLRDIPSPPTPPKLDSVIVKAGDKPIIRWPTQSGVPAYYGSVGQNQARFIPPYQFYLYDSRTKVNSISCHTKVASSLMRVLTRVAQEYSEKELNDLHLNRFFGCLNVRKMKGGSSWSMHSWGIALDFDASRNTLHQGRATAAMARVAYDKWWKCWEDEGWTSLGREFNFDWMHVQAARVR